VGHPQKIKAVGISKVSPVGLLIGNFRVTRHRRIPYPRAPRFAHIARKCLAYILNAMST
jgi:hypothetical protein